MSNLPADPTRLICDADQLRQQGEAKADDALECVHQSGLRLIEAKRLLPHGQFEPYLAQNWGDSLRKAQMYMQLATGWSQIEQKRNSVADLSLRGAIGLLAKPKPAPATDDRPSKPAQKPADAPVAPPDTDGDQLRQYAEEMAQRAAQAESQLSAVQVVNEGAERAAKEIMSRDEQIAALKAENAQLQEQVARWKAKALYWKKVANGSA